MGLLMLDTATTVANVTWADPGTGETEKTPSKVTRSVDMRIQPVDIGTLAGYQQLPSGKRSQTTHKGFADPSANLVEGEIVGVAVGDYANYRWEIVHVDPVHGHHFEVEMKRIPANELVTETDPLA